MKKLTDRKYMTQPPIDGQKSAAGPRVYLVRLVCPAPRWVVGPDLKKPGIMVPAGTEYYTNFDDAMTAYNRAIDEI